MSAKKVLYFLHLRVYDNNVGNTEEIIINNIFCVQK